MTQIKRLYASSGPEVIIETLQITIGSDVHYLCQGYESITATTENGDTVTFSACAIDIALPARNADGTQDLKFALCNIDGVVSTAIRNALANQSVCIADVPALHLHGFSGPCGSAVYAENQVWLLDCDRRADYRGLYEYPRYRLATLPLHATCIPRTALYQLRNPNVQP